MVKAHSESERTPEVETTPAPVEEPAAGAAGEPAATMADLADLEAVVREEVGALRRRLDKPAAAAAPAAAPASPAPAPRRSRLGLVVVVVVLAVLVAGALAVARRHAAVRK